MNMIKEEKYTARFFFSIKWNERYCNNRIDDNTWNEAEEDLELSRMEEKGEYKSTQRTTPHSAVWENSTSWSVRWMISSFIYRIHFGTRVLLCMIVHFSYVSIFFFYIFFSFIRSILLFPSSSSNSSRIGLGVAVAIGTESKSNNRRTT